MSSGIMESLLQVVDWRSPDPSCITFVTRAVRVIDLITNLDMTAFHSLGGWNKLLWRLKVNKIFHSYFVMDVCVQHEVDCCKEELPFILPSEVVQLQQQHGVSEPQSSGDGETASAGGRDGEQMNSTDQRTDDVPTDAVTEETISITEETISITEETISITEETRSTTVIPSLDPAPSTNVEEHPVESMELDHQISTATTTTTIMPTGMGHYYMYTITFTTLSTHITELQCLPQRAALIKSILNFFKKAIPDPTFAENIRNCK